MFQRHDPVTVALFRVPSFHACGHEGAAELLHADARKRARLTLAQQAMSSGRETDRASSSGRAARKWRAKASSAGQVR